VGLHPSLRGLKELFDDGALSIVQGVGYADQDRSHFRSMDIWHSASTQGKMETGWLGRFLDAAQRRDEPAGLPALCLGDDRLPLALTADRIKIPAIQDLTSYKLNLGRGDAADLKRRRRLLDELAGRPTEEAASDLGDDLAFLRRGVRAAYTTADRLQEGLAAYKPTVAYPASSLGDQLQTAARIIAGDVGVRVVYLAMDGFDTHAQQANPHATLMTELAAGLRAFWLDLRGHGVAERVLLMTMSEFGRRVKENASQGTDHGAGSHLMLVGGGAKPGVHGDHPSLTDLDDGDLKFHTDFRRVYATVLEKWLGAPSQNVLAGDWQSMDLLT
ncbi:MAG: DUF1501 domain-containing protein, partial [Planctomycetia bacterium]